METTLGKRTEGRVSLMRTTLVNFKEQEKEKLDWSGMRERERDGRGAHLEAVLRVMSDWSFCSREIYDIAFCYQIYNNYKLIVSHSTFN